MSKESKGDNLDELLKELEIKEKQKRAEEAKGASITLDLTGDSKKRSSGNNGGQEDDTDEEIAELKAQLEEEKRKHEEGEAKKRKEEKKKEAERLKAEIAKYKAINSASANDNNNAKSKDVASNIQSNKTQQELEKRKNELFQEMQSGKKDAQRAERIFELEKKVLLLQKEVSSGPTKSELLAQHEREKKALKEVQFGVDVCFLLDCTGSMARFIAAAKENIRKISEHMQTIDPRVIPRFAFVGYRDFGDEEQYVTLDFIEVENISLFEEKLASVRAYGGADPPEDVVGGLFECTKLSWKASTCVLIHLGDAPCHGRIYHPYEDRYPAGDPAGLKPEYLLQKLLSMRIDYHFLRMAKYTDQMIAIFKQVYIKGKRPFEEHTMGTDPARFLPKVVESIQSSMAQSVAFRQ